jgi:hypothetical protein
MRQERFNYSVRVGEVEMTQGFEYFITFSVQHVLSSLQKKLLFSLQKSLVKEVKQQTLLRTVHKKHIP